MKIKVAGLFAVILCAGLCFALPALGQNSITLTGVNGSTSGGNLCSTASGCEDVYTGLYYSTVNGTANTGTICDDFNHNVTVGETWQATAIQASNLSTSNIGNTEFGSTIGLAGYAEVATLVSEMFTLNNGTGTLGGVTGITGTDLSEAIWDITTKGGITGISSKAAALVTWVQGLLGGDSNAAAVAYLAQYSNLFILTPNPNNGPQEFWSQNGPNFSVPEGGSALLYLLLAGLACFGAMRVSSRSQAQRRESI